MLLELFAIKTSGAIVYWLSFHYIFGAIRYYGHLSIISIQQKGQHCRLQLQNSAQNKHLSAHHQGVKLSFVFPRFIPYFVIEMFPFNALGIKTSGAIVYWQSFHYIFGAIWY
jgi:hypothetical protein